MPATDEVWRLHHLKEADCLYFQDFMNSGIYRDRQGHSTRQGIYCISPSGKLLADINTTAPGPMREMLERALQAWKAMPQDERLLAEDPAPKLAEIQRSSSRFPEGGRALRVYVRDLPGATEAKDWRATAWNLDHAWLKPEELQSLLPQRVSKKATQTWPAAVTRRLARAHLLDYVRGQTTAYDDAHVHTAEVTTTIDKVKRGKASMTFKGEVQICTAAWPEDAPPDPERTRGVDVTLLGRAVWDQREGGFTEFELVAAGVRWGQTQFNFRKDDLGPSPIGWVFTLAPPEERITPSTLGAYGW